MPSDRATVDRQDAAADDAAASESDDLSEEPRGGGSGRWWDVGLLPMLFVAGVTLFVFPEPVTSAPGVVLVVTGIALPVADWAA